MRRAIYQYQIIVGIHLFQRQGKALCCNSQEINLLTGPGSGVALIKVAASDELLGVFKADADVKIEKTTGTVIKLTATDRALVKRAGKGAPIFKRGEVKRLIMPEPTIPVIEEPVQ